MTAGAKLQQLPNGFRQYGILAQQALNLSPAPFANRLTATGARLHLSNLRWSSSSCAQITKHESLKHEQSNATFCKALQDFAAVHSEGLGKGYFPLRPRKNWRFALVDRCALPPMCLRADKSHPAPTLPPSLTNARNADRTSRPGLPRPQLDRAAPQERARSFYSGAPCT